MMPQNNWLATDAPLSCGIYRNIPFALMGVIIIVLFYKSAKEKNDKSFRWMWLTIVLKLCFLYSGCIVGGCDPNDRYADDS